MRRVFLTGLAANALLLGLFIVAMCANTWYWRTFP